MRVPDCPACTGPFVSDHTLLAPTTPYWFVRVKFYHKPGWDYHQPRFSTEQAAEEHAKQLFGVEKWETKKLFLTAKEAWQMEFIRRYFVEWEKQNAKGEREQ
jgi:hypothetical protein